jgi:glutaminyl-tRNA synthetase
LQKVLNKPNLNFIDEIVGKDIKKGKNNGRVCTRVPPEPNGYLHIGHGKSICLNFGIAFRHQGTCNLYFDDTNPSKESEEYVKSICEDIQWLGFQWDKLYYASDQYERLFQIACRLIENGKAYVCQLNADEVREYRGTLTEPGRNSPYRERNWEENLNLFQRMRAGEFPDGYCTLRAKIDMAAPVICMRDPVIYRIMRVTHYRTGDQWVIYPMYDFASPLVDALEGVTHSLCGIEFEDHRPLYKWVIREAGCFPEPPQQIEFAKLYLTRTLLGKRFLRQTVEQGIVSGWDDPRMATLSGMRRRGYPPAAIWRFMELIGVAKANSLVDFSLLEHCVREELGSVERRMVVIRPIRLVIDNYPEEKMEYAELENHPAQVERGVRQVPFTRDLYIERDDFTEDPPAHYYRLFPGAEVRLKGASLLNVSALPMVKTRRWWFIVNMTRGEILG